MMYVDTMYCKNLSTTVLSDLSTVKGERTCVVTRLNVRVLKVMARGHIILFDAYPVTEICQVNLALLKTDSAGNFNEDMGDIPTCYIKKAYIRS